MKRWIRAVLPMGVVLTAVSATLIVHSIERPDPSKPSFLSPTSTAEDGAADLAAQLSSAGIAVDRRTRTPEAIAAATSAPGSTIFVPAPEMIHPAYLGDLRSIPPSVRIVLVTPTLGVLARLGATVPMAGPRWTAAAADPGCGEEFATRPAAVVRWQYYDDDGVTFSCYAGSVVELERADGPPFTLVGASDPFRNDRLGEWGNADFAAGLLSRGRRVVWLDLHEREQPPAVDPALEGRPEQGNEPEQDPDADRDYPDNGEDPDQPSEDGPGQSEPQGGGRSDDGNPLADAFPSAFWATVLLLALALLALALASARRLGAPVAEPLPARVRAAETVHGLGGLYRRARARDASLATVQAAAVRRLAVHFGLPPESDVDTVSEHVAEHLGAPPHEVRALLGGGVEDTDEDLAEKAAAVQRLVRHLIGEQSEGNQL